MSEFNDAGAKPRGRERMREERERESRREGEKTHDCYTSRLVVAERGNWFCLFENLSVQSDYYFSRLSKQNIE